MEGGNEGDEEEARQGMQRQGGTLLSAPLADQNRRPRLASPHLNATSRTAKER